MARYRKKPVVVGAEQWFPGKNLPGVFPGAVGEHRFWVMTAHGQVTYLEPGDWVITEPDDRGHYPCKDSIFRSTYQPVDGGGNAIEWGQ